jgi:hypothetical protein
MCKSYKVRSSFFEKKERAARHGPKNFAPLRAVFKRPLAQTHKKEDSSF